MLQGPLEQGFECAQLHGFFQKPKRFQIPNDGQSFFKAPKPGQDDRRNHVPALPQRAQQLKSIQPRHDQVGDDDVGKPGIEFIESLLPVARRGGFEALLGEHGAQVLPQFGIVVDDQDSPWRRCEVFGIEHSLEIIRATDSAHRHRSVPALSLSI